MSIQIKASAGSPFARLLSVGGYRGSRIVSNAEMCTIIDSTPEWIEQRTGIVERRWANDEETPLFMATAAARKAIQRSGLAAESIDGLIVSTVSHYKQFPSMAVEVARDLGLANPAAFDLSGACAGFCYGVGLADALVRAGTACHVLVIGVEKLSEHTNFADRGTAFLFGDGAGAVVVGPSDVPGIGPTIWGSDGQQAGVIHEPNWFTAWDNGDEKPKLYMEGRTVFKWATTAIAEKTVEILAAAGLAPQQLEVFIPHQANNRITDAMLRRLKLPGTIVVSRDIKHMGNTSAASVPLAMEALLESGEAKSGQTALQVGFGAGLVFAGQVVVLP